jgi:hypothetical protein
MPIRIMNQYGRSIAHATGDWIAVRCALRQELSPEEHLRDAEAIFRDPERFVPFPTLR